MLQEVALTLVCYGISNTPSAETAHTSVTNGLDRVEAHTTVAGRTRTSDRLTVSVEGETVRLRGPASLEPALGGRGNDGWRTLTDVTITDRQIRGQLSYNWVNRPLVTIDRVTGEITMRNANIVAGVSSFTGECERLANETPRF